MIPVLAITLAFTVSGKDIKKHIPSLSTLVGIDTPQTLTPKIESKKVTSYTAKSRPKKLAQPKQNKLDTLSFANVVINSISIKRDSLRADLPGLEGLISSLKVKFSIPDDAKIEHLKTEKKFVFVRVDSARVTDLPVKTDLSVGVKRVKLDDTKDQVPAKGEKIVMIRAIKVSDTTSSNQRVEYVINGKVKNAGELSKIDPKDILQVHVIKNVNGPQILIETKKSN